MCRYGMMTYKPHYACFTCRKTFKRRLLKDINRDRTSPVEAKCPQCGLLTANMGLDFKSPPKEDIKAWQHLKNLYTVGITFHSCGCSGPGYVPQNTEQLIEHLRAKRGEYIEQLRFWLNRPEPVTRKELEKDNQANWYYKGRLPRELKGKKGAVENQQAIAYWNEKIREVELRMEKMATVNARA